MSISRFSTLEPPAARSRVVEIEGKNIDFTGQPRRIQREGKLGAVVPH